MPKTLRQKKRSSGQALIESAILIPFVLAIIFNAVNFGYFYYVALNMSAATRSGALYAMIGGATPVDASATYSGSSYPPADTTATEVCMALDASGKPVASTSTNCTVRYIVYQDMAGALPSANSNASVKVCSQSVGTTITSGVKYAQCQSFSSSTAAGVSAGTAPADPEYSSATGFILHQVDVTYQFRPLIPSVAFGAVLLATPVCNTSAGSITCTFHRKVLMRAM